MVCLKFCQLVLHIFANFRKYLIFLPFVFGKTLFAVEIACNFVAIVNFSKGMGRTINLFWLKIEIFTCVNPFAGREWFEFWESCGLRVIERKCVIFRDVRIEPRLSLLVYF